MMKFLLPLLFSCSAKQTDSGAAPQHGGQGQGGNDAVRRISVAETSSGKLLITDGRGGNVGGEVCLSEIHPDQCSGDTSLANPCLMFGTDIQADGKILLTYALRDPSTPVAPGAISLVTPTHPPTVEWAIQALDLSAELQAQERIDCAADPASPGCHLYGAHNAWILDDGSVLVADTSNSRILWLSVPTSGETAQVNHILSTSHPHWGTERYPNQVQQLNIDGEDHLLITFKGQLLPGNEIIDEGKIVLWNVAHRDTPTRVWAFPEEGGLAAVHQGWVDETPAGNLLLYAHSGGAVGPDAPEQYGSIGFAQFNETEPPTYLGDGTLPSPGLGFTREVEWDEQSQALLVVDSGCENAQDNCGRVGSVLLIELPSLSESDKSGAYTADHQDQAFFEMQLRNKLIERSLRFPFEADPLGEGDLVNIGLCE